MVNPHSPTATGIRVRTHQQSAVAFAFAFFYTFVCKTSERSGVFQDSQIQVNINKYIPTLWRVSVLPNPSKPKQYWQQSSTIMKREKLRFWILQMYLYKPKILKKWQIKEILWKPESNWYRFLWRLTQKLMYLILHIKTENQCYTWNYWKHYVEC